MTELKSLKNPTRILTILMFIAGYICTIGVAGLSKALPSVDPAIIAAIVSICTYAVTQYGTERRVVRAEELKDQEYEQEGIDSSIEDTVELIDDGI